MKLLSATETRDKREQLNTTLSSRSASLDDAIVSKRKELLSMEEEFLRAMENNRLVRMKEEVEWQERNSVLDTETRELEARRKIVLVPLEQKEKELDTRFEVLLQREQSVSKKEAEADKNLELLELRLDDASDRLANASKRSQELSRREEGIKMQEAQTKARTSEFNDVLSKTLLDFDKQRLEIATKMEFLKGTEVILKERESRVNSAEKDLVKREKLLLDRYTTLQRAVEEMKRKGKISPKTKI